jgi:glycosyltransferase involved in cell wall biosynthesis
VFITVRKVPAPPLVSLIMPAWNPREDWLRVAVEGALGQRDCDVELIVVDDGSEKPVADLLSGLEDERMRVLRVEHGGACEARNAGIAVARGQFMRFIDTDDWITPQGTATLLRLTEGRQDLIAYGATVFCDAELRPVWTMTCDLEGDIVEDCVRMRNTSRPHAFLFPRAAVEAAGPWNSDIQVAHDWDFVLRALEHADARATRAPVTFYRRHGGGITADVAAGEEGASEAVARYFERHPEQLGTSLERRVSAALSAHAARAYATHGLLGRAVRRLLRAARLDPSAVWFEFRHSLPALWGRLRARIGGGRRRGDLPSPPTSAEA